MKPKNELESGDKEKVEAAVQGAILAGEGSSQVQDLLLLDVTPLPMMRDCWWRDDQAHRTQHHHPHRESSKPDNVKQIRLQARDALLQGAYMILVSGSFWKHCRGAH